VKNFAGTYVHHLLGFNLYSFSSTALEFFIRHFLTILRFRICAERERERERETHTHTHTHTHGEIETDPHIQRQRREKEIWNKDICNDGVV
jgi:hypothetical protein